MWEKSFERALSLCLHVLDRLKPSSAPRQNLLLPRTQRAQEEGCFSVVVYSRLFRVYSRLSLLSLEESASHAPSKAIHVFGPTMPSGTRPWPRWKARTAASVFGPKLPSGSTP